MLVPIEGVSDTPRTDVEKWWVGDDSWGESFEVVDASFARKLERENAELLALLKVAQDGWGCDLSAAISALCCGADEEKLARAMR